MRVLLSILIALCVTSLVACDVNMNQEMHFTVVVYPIDKRCTVKPTEQEVEVDCMQLGVYLRDTLKINPARQIDVSLSGSTDVPKEDQSIDKVAELIRAAGFKDVRTWRFGL
jgi:hypothetical protein